MLWRSRNCYGTRLARITCPKCTSRNICAYLSIVIRRRGNYLVRIQSLCLHLASMKVPDRRRGNGRLLTLQHHIDPASMKVPARRRGNARTSPEAHRLSHGLNESPRPKAGKYVAVVDGLMLGLSASMKVPTRRWGNRGGHRHHIIIKAASMKVPTRRRGNVGADEGEDDVCKASMKVPAQRQRNLAETDKTSKGHYPHLYYQSAIELVIPPLPCRASLANEQHAARE